MTENREEAVRAARDWAHSIQARFAEKVAGQLARDLDTKPGFTGSHREKFEETALVNGVSQSEINGFFEAGPVEKLGEFDEPITRKLLEGLFAELISTIKMLGMPDVADRMMISSLPSGAVSALCCKNSWDPFVHIFVDSDLAVFCGSVAKIVLTCIMSKTTGELLEPDEVLLEFVNPDLQWRVRNLFHSAVFHGSVRASQPFLTEASLAFPSVTLASSMQGFVLAHELGHLVLGHIDSDEDMSAIAVPDLGGTDVLLFSRDAEFAADNFGTLIATTAARVHSERIFDLAGSYVFMKAVHVLDACNAVAGTREGGIDSTHPPAHERAAAIKSILQEKIPIGPAITPVLETIDAVFYKIRGLALAEIARLLAQGIEPRKRQMLRVYEHGERPAILGAFDIQELFGPEAAPS